MPNYRNKNRNRNKNKNRNKNNNQNNQNKNNSKEEQQKPEEECSGVEQTVEPQAAAITATTGQTSALENSSNQSQNREQQQRQADETANVVIIGNEKQIDNSKNKENGQCPTDAAAADDDFDVDALVEQNSAAFETVSPQTTKCNEVINRLNESEIFKMGNNKSKFDDNEKVIVSEELEQQTVNESNAVTTMPIGTGQGKVIVHRIVCEDLKSEPKTDSNEVKVIIHKVHMEAKQQSELTENQTKTEQPNRTDEPAETGETGETAEPVLANAKTEIKQSKEREQLQQHTAQPHIHKLEAEAQQTKLPSDEQPKTEPEQLDDPVLLSTKTEIKQSKQEQHAVQSMVTKESLIIHKIGTEAQKKRAKAKLPAGQPEAAQAPKQLFKEDGITAQLPNQKDSLIIHRVQLEAEEEQTKVKLAGEQPKTLREQLDDRVPLNAKTSVQQIEEQSFAAQSANPKVGQIIHRVQLEAQEEQAKTILHSEQPKTLREQPNDRVLLNAETTVRQTQKQSFSNAKDSAIIHQIHIESMEPKPEQLPSEQPMTFRAEQPNDKVLLNAKTQAQQTHKIQVESLKSKQAQLTSEQLKTLREQLPSQQPMMFRAEQADDRDLLNAKTQAHQTHKIHVESLETKQAQLTSEKLTTLRAKSNNGVLLNSQIPVQQSQAESFTAQSATSKDGSIIHKIHVESLEPKQAQLSTEQLTTLRKQQNEEVLLNAQIPVQQSQAESFAAQSASSKDGAIVHKIHVESLEPKQAQLPSEQLTTSRAQPNDGVLSNVQIPVQQSQAESFTAQSATIKDGSIIHKIHMESLEPMQAQLAREQLETDLNLLNATIESLQAEQKRHITQSENAKEGVIIHKVQLEQQSAEVKQPKTSDELDSFNAQIPASIKSLAAPSTTYKDSGIIHRFLTEQMTPRQAQLSSSQLDDLLVLNATIETLQAQQQQPGYTVQSPVPKADVIIHKIHLEAGPQLTQLEGQQSHGEQHEEAAARYTVTSPIEKTPATNELRHMAGMQTALTSTMTPVCLQKLEDLEAESKSPPLLSPVRIQEVKTDDDMDDLEENKSPLVSEVESGSEDVLTMKISTPTAAADDAKQRRKQKRKELETHFLPKILNPRFLDSISEENNDLAQTAAAAAFSSENNERSLSSSAFKPLRPLEKRRYIQRQEITIPMTLETRLFDIPEVDQSRSILQSAHTLEAETPELIYINSASSSMSDLRSASSSMTDLNEMDGMEAVSGQVSRRSPSQFDLDTDATELVYSKTMQKKEIPNNLLIENIHNNINELMCSLTEVAEAEAAKAVTLKQNNSLLTQANDEHLASAFVSMLPCGSSSLNHNTNTNTSTIKHKQVNSSLPSNCSETEKSDTALLHDFASTIDKAAVNRFGLNSSSLSATGNNTQHSAIALDSLSNMNNVREILNSQSDLHNSRASNRSPTPPPVPPPPRTLPLLSSYVEHHNSKNPKHATQSALNNSELTRQESIGSQCSDSTQVSQCTAICMADNVINSTATTTTTFSDLNDKLQPEDPKKLRLLCAETLAALPYGDEVLEELATIAQNIGEVRATNVVQHNSELATEQQNKMPYPLPELPHINDLQLALKQNSAAAAGNQKPAADIQQPSEKPWLAVPTNADPKLLVCLSPSQTSYIRQQLQSNNPDDLLAAHQKFVERRGYHEYTKEQLQSLEQQEKLAEEQLLKTTAIMKELRKSLTPTPPPVPPPPVPAKSLQTAAKAKYQQQQQQQLMKTKTDDVSLKNNTTAQTAEQRNQSTVEQEQAENNHRLLAIIKDNSNEIPDGYSSFSHNSEQLDTKQMRLMPSEVAKQSEQATASAGAIAAESDSTSKFAQVSLPSDYTNQTRPSEQPRGVTATEPASLPSDNRNQTRPVDFESEQPTASSKSASLPSDYTNQTRSLATATEPAFLPSDNTNQTRPLDSKSEQPTASVTASKFPQVSASSGNMQSVETVLGKMFPSIGSENIFDRQQKRFSNIEQTAAGSHAETAQPKRYSSIETHYYETEKRIENGKVIHDHTTSKHESHGDGGAAGGTEGYVPAKFPLLSSDNKTQDNENFGMWTKQTLGGGGEGGAAAAAAPIKSNNVGEIMSALNLNNLSTAQKKIETKTSSTSKTTTSSSSSTIEKDYGCSQSNKNEKTTLSNGIENVFEEFRQRAKAAAEANNAANVTGSSSSTAQQNSNGNGLNSTRTADHEKLFKEFDDLSKQLHMELETSKQQREQRELSASMFDLSRMKPAVGNQKQQIEQFKRQRHDHLMELEQQIEKSMQSRRLRSSQSDLEQTDGNGAGRSYEIPIQLENGHVQAAMHSDETRSRRAESMFNLSDDMSNRRQRTYSNQPAAGQTDNWSKYASDLGYSENIARPFAREVEICYQRQRPAGIRAPRLTASTNDLSWQSAAAQSYDQMNAYNVRRSHAPMLNAVVAQAKRPHYGSCYSMIERNPNPTYISTTSRRGVSPAPPQSNGFNQTQCYDAERQQRRASLPREIHEQQLKYILSKEDELRLEFERIQNERRRLMEEMEKSQPDQPITAKPRNGRAENYRSTQKLPTLSEDEVFRQQMAEEWMNKVAEREERRLQKIIKISKIHEEEEESAQHKKPDIGNEFLSRVKERRYKLNMPADSDWESGAESQPVQAGNQGQSSETESEIPIKVIEGKSEVELRRLPQHLREFARLSTHLDEQDVREEKHEEQQRQHELQGNMETQAFKKTSMVKTVRTLRAPMLQPIAATNAADSKPSEFASTDNDSFPTANQTESATFDSIAADATENYATPQFRPASFDELFGKSPFRSSILNEFDNYWSHFNVTSNKL